MEASALHAPAGVSRLRNTAGASFLRLRSDDQLVELFRDGHEEAFRVIHDRYRARLFAYMRQMLSGSRQDAEDALQDVFIRAYSGLRANDRHLALRAWLYRVAHNRCVDQLRKNMPILTEEIEATSQDVSTDPQAAVQQREDLRKLITDVQRLPEQQRSALLMREMSGMTYQELADSLDLSIPAIKSLLVRARGGLAAAAEARDTDCSQIRTEIVDSHERGARPSALTRRHLSDCAACREYRESVRGMSKTLAALVPAGPLILAVKLLGLGSAYSAAAYSSGAGATVAGGAAAGGAAVTAVSGAAAAAAGGAATAAGGAATAAGGAVSLSAASAGAASAGAAAAGSAAAGGAAAAGGVAAGGVAAAGGAAAGGAAVAGGVSAAHIAAIVAAAAAAGGAVAVTDQSSHHAAAPLHPASRVIRQAVANGVSHGYAPAAAAPVAAVTPVTPATAPASNAASTIAKAVVTKLKHQESTPTVGTTAPSATSTTAASTVAGVTATTAAGTPTTASTGAGATGGAGLTTATTASGISPSGFASGTSTTPANSSTVATTPSAAATTPAGTSSPTDTTPARSDSTSSAGATTASSSTTPSATASPTGTMAPSPQPAG